LLPKLNGVLFPGGALDFDIEDRWTSNADFILKYAIQQNDAGNVFPIFGTCMGLQLLGYLTNDYVCPLSPVEGQKYAINTIKFESNDKGTLFNEMPSRILTKLTTGKGMVFFNH